MALEGERRRDTFSRWLFAIALAGLALRVSWVLAERNTLPVTDGQFYFGLARALARGKGFLEPYTYARTGQVVANANHTPAWPLLLALPHVVGIHSRLASELFAALVGTGTVVAMGYAGREISGRRVGLIAAAISAVYANFWVYEHELMSETLVLLLVALVMLCAYRFRKRPHLGTVTVLGVLCGLLTLTHPNNALLIPFLVVPLVLVAPGIERSRRIGLLVAPLLVSALIIVPWAAYNEARFRDPVVLTTAFGYTLATANCPASYFGSGIGSWQVLCSFPLPVGDASEKDAEWRARGQRYASAHMSRLPLVLAAREGRAWSIFRPFQQTHLDSRIGSPLWVERHRLFTYWLLAPAAIGGAVILRRRRVTLFPLLAVFAEVVVTAALAFGDTRYRAPAEVAIVLLAAVAVDALWLRWRRRWHPARS